MDAVPFGDELRLKIEEYALASPDREACGAIFDPDDPWGSPTFYPIPNTSPDPDMFTFLGSDLLKALAEVDGRGGIIALFHSHRSDRGPSETDYRVSMDLGGRLFAPPPWRWSTAHYVFCLPTRRWWEYQ